MNILSNRDIIAKDFDDYLTDESKFRLGIPSAIFFPETVSELIEITKKLYLEGKRISISGGKTGITGGSVPADGDALISMKNLNRILRVEKKSEEIIMTCEPGITLEEIDLFLSKCAEGNPLLDIPGIELIRGKNYFYPPDPTETSAQLGGTIATNASGARTFGYGPTREHIHSLSMIIKSGETITIREKENKLPCQLVDLNINRLSYEKPKMKSAAGYYSGDYLLQCIVGSEGTLGIFYEISVKLKERPKTISAISFFENRDDAFNFANYLRNNNKTIAIEYFDKSALELLEKADIFAISVPSPPIGRKYAVFWEITEPSAEELKPVSDKLIQNGSSFDLSWSGITEQEKIFLKRFRHAVPELINSMIGLAKKNYPNIKKISTDVALRSNVFYKITKDFELLLQEKRLNYAIFGHLGDYHLHINIIPKDMEEYNNAVRLYQYFMEKVSNSGGVISAEHGIGKIKKEYLKLMFSRDNIDEMRSFRKIFDPEELFNRGNLF